MVSQTWQYDHAQLDERPHKKRKHSSRVQQGNKIPSTISSIHSLNKTRASARVPPLPTMQEKRQCFQERDVVMCPASPPVSESPLISEEESNRQSQERIEVMSRRLAKLPLCQARNMINLACAQLHGPFAEGCRYWGTTRPISTTPTEIGTNNHGPVPNPSRPRPGPSRDPQPTHEVLNPPSVPLVFPRLVPSTPTTPHGIRSISTKLKPAKTSVGRSMVSLDDVALQTARSPSPTPSSQPHPRASSQAARSSQAPVRMHNLRLSQTPRLSQIVNVSYPPQTPMSQPDRSMVEPPVRVLGSVARRVSGPLPPRGPHMFPMPSTPMQRQVEDALLSRESSPLLRFSQKPPSQIRESSSSQQKPAEFLSSKIISQRGSSGEDFFNSQLSFNRQLQDISDFIEDDIALV